MKNKITIVGNVIKLIREDFDPYGILTRNFRDEPDFFPRVNVIIDLILAELETIKPQTNSIWMIELWMQGEKGVTFDFESAIKLFKQTKIQFQLDAIKA